MIQFSRFLDRLKSIKEKEGTLLDNCVIQYGSALSNGNAHNPEALRSCSPAVEAVI